MHEQIFWLAEHDDVVPEVHTHRLMASSAGAKTLGRISGTIRMEMPGQAATLTAVATCFGSASAAHYFVRCRTEQTAAKGISLKQFHFLPTTESGAILPRFHALPLEKCGIGDPAFAAR